MPKLEKLVSHLQIFYTDNKFLRSVNQENPWPRQTVYLDYASWKHLCKTSWRRLEDIFARRISKTSWRCLEDLLKTSWRCFEDVFARRLEDVLKTYGHDEYIGLDQNVLKTSSEDVWLRWIYSSWWRRLENVLEMSSEDEDERRLQNVFKTPSSRRMFPGLTTMIN